MREGVVTWAEVDLNALSDNVRAFKKYIGPKVELFAVVKANAYGHGAVPVARAALAAGAERLAVHRALEGEELRAGEIEAPVLIMGYTPPDGADLIVRRGLTPTVSTMELAQALSVRAVAGRVNVPVHVKVDTGMSRYGLMPEEVLPFLRALNSLPGLRLEGLYTHFATADSLDQTFVSQQFLAFNQVIQAVRANGFIIPLMHAANSAATLRLPQAHFNAVRCGIALYGMQPSDEWAPPFELKPVLTLKSTIARVRILSPGTAVGYGRTFIAKRLTRAALVPIGYGDGYHRTLSNKGIALIRGGRAPVIGRVSMDQIVVDATDIPDAQQDDEVVLIGRQENEQIRAEEVARLAGTINYEVTTSLTARIVRVYLFDDKR